MSFEVFKETRTRTKEYISVTENNTFGLPRTFIDKQGITPAHRAVILYDAETNKVALHFTLKETKYSLSVRIPNKTQGGMVVAKSFFELKNIDPKKYSGRYHDFEVVPLKQLINVESDGYAYVIQLREKERKPETGRGTETAEEQKNNNNEGPINLDDIPF